MSSDRPSTPPTDAGGALPGGGVVETCPCPTDFVLTTPCRILQAGGGRVVFTASELPTCPTAGSYTWTTTSTKIRLSDASTSTCTVEGLAIVGSGRDSEVITVTRSGPGCTPIVKTVRVTVAKVVFSVSASQRFGYDNMDTPANPDDDHLCVKKLDHTFVKVDITGGAVGTDFDFVCDPVGICTVATPAATASFDMQVNGGDHDKASTALQAKVRCPGNAVFSSIQVHVYKEKLVEVVVAKIHDSTQAGTNLSYGTADYASHTATVNDKLKEAVVRYDITNFDAANGQTDVRYDLDGNGVLSFDIGAGGGRELTAIANAMTGATVGTRMRVAIVKDMKSYYYLAANGARGATTITVTAPATASWDFPPGSFPLGAGATLENVSFASRAGNVYTLAAPLTKDHLANEPLEFPAGGWATDPIIIIEGSLSLLVAKWTVAHETGHRALTLADIDGGDTTTFMYYAQSWTDYRLRYCPRTKRYPPQPGTGPTENQWELIPRT